VAIAQEFGAAAGLAGVAGLAVLCVLHISQARDVKRLRAWAGLAADARGTVPLTTARRIGARHVAAAVVGLLVLVGVAAHSDDGSPRKPKRKAAAVKPGNVTVAVLNATTVTGLAATLRDQLAAAGFREGSINVFSHQGIARSVVQYAPGHQAEAKAVSRRLGVSRREPITADSRGLAGDATVVVIAGADKAP
jgi:hypothetical protein